MTRKITMMALLLIAGIVLGAVATEGFNVYRQSHDSQIFQERLQCKALADAYVKENTSDWEGVVSLIPGKVDYSPARNSCVAGIETVKVNKSTLSAITTDSVQDLFSGETLFSGRCIDDCGAPPGFPGFPGSLDSYIDRAFDYVMKNTSNPTELEKEWVNVESKNLAPQKQYLDPNTGEPIQIDPVTGERIQSPASPKSGIVPDSEFATPAPTSGVVPDSDLPGGRTHR